MVQKSTPATFCIPENLSHIATMTEGILVNKPVQKQWSMPDPMPNFFTAYFSVKNPKCGPFLRASEVLEGLRSRKDFFPITYEIKWLYNADIEQILDSKC